MPERRPAQHGLGPSGQTHLDGPRQPCRTPEAVAPAGRPCGPPRLAPPAPESPCVLENWLFSPFNTFALKGSAGSEPRAQPARLAQLGDPAATGGLAEPAGGDGAGLGPQTFSLGLHPVRSKRWARAKDGAAPAATVSWVQRKIRRELTGRRLTSQHAAGRRVLRSVLGGRCGRRAPSSPPLPG